MSSGEHWDDGVGRRPTMNATTPPVVHQTDSYDADDETLNANAVIAPTATTTTTTAQRNKKRHRRGKNRILSPTRTSSECICNPTVASDDKASKN